MQDGKGSLQSDIDPDRFDVFDTLDGSLQSVGRIQPAELRYGRIESSSVIRSHALAKQIRVRAERKLIAYRLDGVHLDSREPLSFPRLGLFQDVRRSITSDPSVYVGSFSTIDTKTCTTCQLLHRKPPCGHRVGMSDEKME
jgi:hypothetical protein